VGGGDHNLVEDSQGERPLRPKQTKKTWPGDWEKHIDRGKGKKKTFRVQFEDLAGALRHRTFPRGEERYKADLS